MNLTDLAKNFSTEEAAIKFLERKLWPDGPVCPKCGLIGEAYEMHSRPESKNKMRPGLWKCSSCRKTFRVTVNTIFEDSHIPLHKWMMAIHLMCASKKGMSAHQLHRMLGLGYRAAWFMAHRIRYAMNEGGTTAKLGGTIEADETLVGGKLRGHGCYAARQKKTPVVTLVERNGRARSFHFESVSAANLRPLVRECIEQGANLMTDDSGLYDGMRDHFGSHDVVRHSAGEYSRREGAKIIHTNTVEGYFSILKRGIMGTFHHVSRQHLGRYLDEFDFRYNARDTSDGERAELAIKGVTGKRLMYRDSYGEPL
jgi:transposase-like protein